MDYIINNIDFVAFIFIISSLLLIAKKKRYGWWIGCLGQIVWISWALFSPADRAAVGIQSVVLLGLNLYGGLTWGLDNSEPL